MQGLNAVKTLGVRLSKTLNEQIECAVQALNTPGSFGFWNKSDIARNVLEDFFLGRAEFKKKYAQALKKCLTNRSVKQAGSKRKK